MRNFRTILISIAALVALTGFAWFGYNLYQRFHRPAESPFNAIPGNTACILQLNKAGNLLEELNRSNLLWKALSSFPGINVERNELQFIDSASRQNQKINKIFQQNNILVSISLSGRTNFGALYLTTVTDPNPDSFISEFIQALDLPIPAMG